MPTGVVLTYRDYEALPADGRRYELHDGQLFVTAAPGVPHQRVVGRLFALLRQHAEDHRLGEVLVAPVDCILSETTVVQPDIVYVESARGSLVSARGIEGPPNRRVRGDRRCVSRGHPPHRRGSRFAAAIVELADRSRDAVARK